MDNALQNISDHIHELGLGVLSQAQRNAFYTDYAYETRLDEGVFSVIQAAHAAELLIKAAIAKEHPLLIFSTLPKSNSANGEFLSFEDLFENAKTIQYSELPERLWSSTGYKIGSLETYNSFGKLRNCIQHFATPNYALSYETSDFIYEIIDPILEKFWGEVAVDYVDLSEHQDDFFEILAHRGIKARFPEHYRENAERAYEKI